jgi:uncharacterized protein with GYD domain
METYIILGNYTREGINEIKDGPSRIQAVRETVEAAGGKFLGWYLTMGRYDFVAIMQLPDAKVAASIILGIGRLGKVSTETLRSWTEAEFKELVAGLR